MLEDDIRIPPPGYRSAPQRRAAETRRMAMAVGGVAAILLVCVVGYVAATGGGRGGVPVIAAPTGAVKVRPTDPGGLQVNTQTNALLGSGGGTGGANLAPGPEQPDPAALAAAADQEQSSPKLAAPSPDARPGAVAQASAPAAPAVNVPAVPETSAPSGPSGARTAINLPPSSAGAGTDHNLAQEYSPPSQNGHVRVQLAALDSHEAAMREWDRLTHHMPELFDGRRPIFTEAHVDGHIFWRVRTAGFVSVAEATRFCDDVRSHGAACTVALF